MKHQLTPEERDIEHQADDLQSVGEEQKQRVQSILDRAKRSQAISLRLSEADLALIKRRAEKEGIPYQTLINAVLHKYVTDQLYDKDELRKVVAGLQEMKAL